MLKTLDAIFGGGRSLQNNSETDFAAEHLLMHTEIVSAFSCLLLVENQCLCALIDNITFLISDLWWKECYISLVRKFPRVEVCSSLLQGRPSIFQQRMRKSFFIGAASLSYVNERSLSKTAHYYQRWRLRPCIGVSGLYTVMMSNVLKMQWPWVYRWSRKVQCLQP